MRTIVLHVVLAIFWAICICAAPLYVQQSVLIANECALPRRGASAAAELHCVVRPSCDRETVQTCDSQGVLDGGDAQN